MFWLGNIIGVIFLWGYCPYLTAQSLSDWVGTVKQQLQEKNFEAPLNLLTIVKRDRSQAFKPVESPYPHDDESFLQIIKVEDLNYSLYLSQPLLQAKKGVKPIKLLLDLSDSDLMLMKSKTTAELYFPTQKILRVPLKIPNNASVAQVRQEITKVLGYQGVVVGKTQNRILVLSLDSATSHSSQGVVLKGTKNKMIIGKSDTVGAVVRMRRKLDQWGVFTSIFKTYPLDQIEVGDKVILSKD